MTTIYIAWNNVHDCAIRNDTGEFIGKPGRMDNGELELWKTAMDNNIRAQNDATTARIEYKKNQRKLDKLLERNTDAMTPAQLDSHSQKILEYTKYLGEWKTAEEELKKATEIAKMLGWAPLPRKYNTETLRYF
jgi:hypothetical protein